uniref:Cytochrome b5 heme-binding domain-containing protein n=1 Tax=Aegilops tauschii subsp. strangulata TaxID=200361 RepID=A0A453P6N6_AEGTS
MAGGGKVYSFQEVRKHSQRKDCWLIISGKVYDVTPFMEEHPGGDEVLLACTGEPSPPIPRVLSLCSGRPGMIWHVLLAVAVQARTRRPTSRTSATRTQPRS